VDSRVLDSQAVDSPEPARIAVAARRIVAAARRIAAAAPRIAVAAPRIAAAARQREEARQRAEARLLAARQWEQARRAPALALRREPPTRTGRAPCSTRATAGERNV
jgi:hypothetical protein